MNKRMGQRVICATLALELLLSPLAMARTENPTNVWQETPMGEEAVTTGEGHTVIPSDDLPAGDSDAAAGTPDHAPSGGSPAGEDAAPDQARLSDVPVVPGHTYVAVSYGLNIQETFNGYFKAEHTEKGDPWTSTGSRSGHPKWMSQPDGTGGDWYLTAPILGRVPDYEWGGFYLMSAKPEDWFALREGDTAVDDLTAVNGWRYDPAWPEEEAIPLAETEKKPAAVDLDADSDYDVYQRTWNKVYTVTDAALQSAITHGWVSTNTTTNEGWYYDDSGIPQYGEYTSVDYFVPVVGRWVKSAHNELTALNITAAIEGDEEDPVSTVPVERLLLENPTGVPDPATLALGDITETSFLPAEDGGEDLQTEFWLRVPEEQSALTFSFNAYEPYYAFNARGEGNTPVSVQYTFNGVTHTVPFVANTDPVVAGMPQVRAGWYNAADGTYANPMIPASGQNGYYEASGDVAERTIRARSCWTVADIPLGKASDAVDGAGNLASDTRTTITITLAAPNGETKEYVFHVERLVDLRGAMGLGNSPIAVIENDTSAKWGTDPMTVIQNKADAVASFRRARAYGDGVITPSQVHYTGQYDIRAWTGFTWKGQSNYDLDLDLNAVFAYQDAAFDDPGVVFYGADGQRVLFGDSATDARYEECVTRTIQLKTAPKLTADLFSVAPGGGLTLAQAEANAGITPCWYTEVDGRGALSDSSVSQVLRLSEGTDRVDLRGLNVVPGVYTMTYTYRDPVNNGQLLTLQRPLVILPIPGDVDMDGAVTAADAIAIEANDGWGVATTAQRLLRYRVLPVSTQVEDLASENAAAIYQGFQPAVSALRTRPGSAEQVAYTDYFYPLLDVTETYQRKTWQEVENEGAATLELRFLGVETGTRMKEGHTIPADGQSILGPWAIDPAQPGVVTLADPAHEPGTQHEDDVFWVGVYLTVPDGSALKGRTVEDLTFSLTYDSAYVQPTAVYRSGQFESAADDEERWWETVFYYNVNSTGSRPNGEAQTLFSGLSGGYVLNKGTVSDRSYETHYSKVVGELETAQKADSLKEVVISLQGRSGGAKATLKSGCLVALPFRLVDHPAKDRLTAQQTARLIELSAGMRDFNLVYSGSGSGQAYAMGSGVELFAAGTTTTTAFSAQKAIYGGGTENLREELSYDTQAGMIPLGENKSTAIPLPDGEYGVPYTYKQGNFTSFDTRPVGELPSGIQFMTGQGLTGTPTAAGEYEITLERNGRQYTYSLLIKPRPIQYWAQSRTSYYGETEYRGEGNTDFGFNYQRSALAYRDWKDEWKADVDAQCGAQATTVEKETWARENYFTADRAGEWGNAAADGLEGMVGEGYQEPSFTAMERHSGGDVPVSRTTLPLANGSYPVVEYASAESRNYEFQYVEGRSDLTISKRPIWVDYIEADYAALSDQVAQNYLTSRIYNDDISKDVRIRLVEEDDPEHLKVHLAFDNRYVVNGKYNDRNLTGEAKVPGDSIAISFAGQFQRTAQDQANLPDSQDFYLTQATEARPIACAGGIFLLPDSDCAQKYTLAGYGGETGVNAIHQSVDGEGNPVTDVVTGIVMRRTVSDIRITRKPSVLKGETARFGDTVRDHYELMVQVDREGILVGDHAYNYNGPAMLSLGIHYNWVSDAEYRAGTAAGQKNSIVGSGCTLVDGELVDGPTPYNADTILTPAMDGWRLCIIAKRYATANQDGEENAFVKVYSDEVLHVSTLTLSLTAQPMVRYYGEDNAAATYRYSYTSLPESEKDIVEDWVKAKYGPNARPTGAAEELEALLSGDPVFQANRPKLTAMRRAAKPASGVGDVTSTTPAGEGYYVVLYGAKATNYDFYYERSGQDVGSTDFGYSTMTIYRRPIIVDAIYSAAGTAGYATIYADTKRLLLDSQVDGETKTPFAASGSQVSFKVPSDVNDEGRVVYFSDPGSGPVSDVPVAAPCTFRNTQAVLSQDAANLKVSYQVRFIPDQNHGTWESFSRNFYNVEALTETGGQGQRPVELCALTLSGTAAGNYQLVYPLDSRGANTYAQRRAPASATPYVAPDPNDYGSLISYMTCGTGTVILRPIKTLTLRSVGQMSYRYGQRFAPNQSNLNGGRFTLQVSYDTRYDNFRATSTNDRIHNVSTDTFDYRPEPIIDANGVETTSNTFTQRGFTIHYLADPNATTAQKQAIAAAGSQVLEDQDPLYCRTHDGKYLFVSGKRGENDPVVCSAASSVPLTVSKATLTLTARDLHRYYGEPNTNGYVVPLVSELSQGVTPTAFQYTLSAGDLAEWDRAKLGGDVTASTTVTQAQMETAFRTDASFGYRAPVIGVAKDEQGRDLVTATTGMNADDGRGNRWGKYDIDITTLDFTNYAVRGQGASLYIYPRPIRVAGVTSDTSGSNNVYTIYSNTGNTRFKTQLSNENGRVVLTQPIPGTNSYFQNLQNGPANAPLPLSGEAVPDGAKLVFNAIVDYCVLPEMNGENDIYDHEVVVEFNGFYRPDADPAQNYTIINPNQGDLPAYGAVKLRTIGAIYIDAIPTTRGYTYGDTLDLSGLTVRVVYKKTTGEADPDMPFVAYDGADQFRSYGLYVNYWTIGETVPTAPDQRLALPATYRQATTGDHLTIAPTHDTQGSAKPFSHLGKGLIISAFPDGDNQVPATPKLVALTRSNLDGYDSYEATASVPAAGLEIAPRRLEYTLSATDKTYDGDAHTAGTLTLLNVFDRTGQVLAGANPTRITDVVYVSVGAPYEDQGPDHASYGYDSYRAAMDNGVISFTTGSYAGPAQGILEDNTPVAYADGYQWDRGMLEFTFADQNVHYVDDTFQDGAPMGVGTPELAAYWRDGVWEGQDKQTHNTPDTAWDAFPEVSTLPVEVRNMTLAGPDAANYTWGPSSPDPNARLEETQVTLDTLPATLGTRQAGVPFATIHRANRDTAAFSAAARDGLPTLEVDNHSNVVKLNFSEDLLSAVQSAGDDYGDELHFEYALYYRDDQGLYTQWAGRDGDRRYQDTTFFGGEVVRPTIDSGYVPDLSRLKDPSDAGANTVYQGQRYRWAEADTGVSSRGRVEDGGFRIDPTAYPGYDTYGDQVLQAYWNYSLYTTDRAPLPRDTVFYPLVRMAQTHNFNPSGDLTADGGADAAAAPAALLAAQTARDRYEEEVDQGEADLSGIQNASDSLFQALAELDSNAHQAALAQVRRDSAQAESTDWPDEPPAPDGPAPAVKTYRQRLDVLSATRARNTTGTTDYLVETLEALWFTDTTLYHDSKLMDAVVFNHPTRYRGYFWDVDRSARMDFQKAPIDLSTRLEGIEIRRRLPDGTIEATTMTYDPVLSGNTVPVYIQTGGGGSTQTRGVQIVPSVLYVRLGDPPYQLSVVSDPPMPSNRVFTWTSSDPDVVSVDQDGLLTFRGEGKAVITVETDNGRTATMTVVVSAVLPAVEAAGEGFNFRYQGPWMYLDGDYAFHPTRPMTRSDLVELLDLFRNPSDRWTATRELPYVDVTGKEKYYAALYRLTSGGVVVGIPGDIFAGDQLATRAEFATMLCRLLELDVPDTRGQVHVFDDSTERDTWAYAYIDALAKAGVIRGVGGGEFAPNRVITREEAAAIIARLLTVKVDTTRTDLLRPSDMTPENWSYPAVLQAVNTVLFPD